MMTNNLTMSDSQFVEMMEQGMRHQRELVDRRRKGARYEEALSFLMDLLDEQACMAQAVQEYVQPRQAGFTACWKD